MGKKNFNSERHSVDNQAQNNLMEVMSAIQSEDLKSWTMPVQYVRKETLSVGEKKDSNNSLMNQDKLSKNNNSDDL